MCVSPINFRSLYSPRTWVASSTIKILKSARRGAKRLQRTLKKYDNIKNSSEGVLAADAQIRDAARKLEDQIESEASAQFFSQSQSHDRRFSFNLHHLKNDITCFLETAKKMRVEYMEELNKKQFPRDHEDVSSTSEYGGLSDMIGLSDMFLRIRDYIYKDKNSHFYSLSISGMAGVGKTALAKKLFHDSLLKKKFQHRAFVRVGPKYVFEEILQAILAQIDVGSKNKMITEGDENIKEYFLKFMRERKPLIVLDDIWDDKFDSYFNGLMLKHKCGFVLGTSRIEGAHRELIVSYPLRFLDKEESWELLRMKVFGELQECPSQLVKAGKKIAENCEGLPLLILTVAALLFKAPKSLDYWKEVAGMKNSVFEDALDQIYEVLLPSYHYLNQNSKACFLYMGIFPKNCLVRRSRINHLWRAERFCDEVSYVFDDLAYSNLVVVRQKRLQYRGRPKLKACNFHVLCRHMSKRESNKTNFLHIIYRYEHGSVELIKGKRHLAIYHNTLLAMKEVHNWVAMASTLRSILCTGPYHQYEVPILCLELKLLRVLDALTIRFYEFPAEVVNLIQLRYLSLTTNANLPPPINKLWFLEYLIVHQHISINHNVADESSSCMPVEIWELQELKLLQVIGRNLPHPPVRTILPNLTQLLDVGVQTCVKGVLDSIPKLEKLRIQSMSAPETAQTMSSADHILCLEKLKSLKSVVLNPKVMPEPTVPPRLLSLSMYGLKKLSLSGFGYPWEDMSEIAELPHLHILKLQSYAFRGEKWEAKDIRFSKHLNHLLIEDTDLVHWTAALETFPNVECLIIRNC